MGSARWMMLSAGAIAVLFAAPAAAEWRPSKPIEFVATAGPGGGTDNLARTVQSIIVKYKLTDQPVVVVNKGGGSGAEGYTYGKALAGDPYKVIFGTSNAWQQPMVSRVAFKHTDLTPIAAMAQDEFLLWVKQDAPYAERPKYHYNGRLARYSHLRGIRSEHPAVPAAAHGLAARQSHGGSGGLLCRADEEGARHARVERIHRAHVTDRYFLDRSGV